MTKQQLCILGSTGSVGLSTLDIVRQHPERFQVQSLSAHQNIELLWQQCLEFLPQTVVVSDLESAEKFEALWKINTPKTLESLKIMKGAQALETIAADIGNTTVMASIVGAAGLPSTLAAARSGKRVLLANKESLVMSGDMFMKTVKTHSAELLPIDSEHNAIFQCLASNRGEGRGKPEEVNKLILTASGGPFLGKSKTALEHVTPEQACAHPKWNMGQKISVDSATLMNKGLEVIEACLLFDVAPDKVEVLVHPESIIHSMVSYCDGSVISQMANPDMKIPIAYGLSWPERVETGVEALNLLELGQLSFQKPDLDNFPCLALAYRALNSGALAINALNAANEVAVEAFLNRSIKFTDIPVIITSVLDELDTISIQHAEDLDSILIQDSEARALAEKAISLTKQ